MVIDYRRLNDNIIDDAYVIPDKTKLINSIRDNKMFGKFDCKSGIWQIKMHPDSIVGIQIFTDDRERKHKAENNNKKTRFMWFGKIAYVHGRTRVFLFNIKKDCILQGIAHIYRRNLGHYLKRNKYPLT